MSLTQAFSDSCGNICATDYEQNADRNTIQDAMTNVYDAGMEESSNETVLKKASAVLCKPLAYLSSDCHACIGQMPSPAVNTIQEIIAECAAKSYGDVATSVLGYDANPAPVVTPTVTAAAAPYQAENAALYDLIAHISMIENDMINCAQTCGADYEGSEFFNMDIVGNAFQALEGLGTNDVINSGIEVTDFPYFCPPMRNFGVECNSCINALPDGISGTVSGVIAACRSGNYKAGIQFIMGYQSAAFKAGNY